ncbi:MAG TPA: RDD family protein [Candidatus Stackebrandtia faecavium]|nr:RDD family protein [Candidatus Stackebrandtia faecavium]
MTKIEPGWYPDPAAPTTQRYWDGEQWIGKAVGIDQTPPETPEPLPPPEPVEEPQRPTEPEQSAPPQFNPLFGAPPIGAKFDEIMAGRELAHPGLRFVARIIDTIVVALLNVLVNGWFIYQYVLETAPTVRKVMADPSIDPTSVQFSDRAYRLQMLILLLAILLWFAYEVPSTVNSGQTLGKRIMGIKVDPIFADKLRYGTIMSRWSLLMLPLACFPVGIALALVDCGWCLRDRPFKQCLHDKTPGTIVVTTSTAPPQRNAQGDHDASPDARRP